MKIDLGITVVIAALCLCGCRQDMQDQPKIKPLSESNFFSDGRASRPIPENTIAQNELNDNDTFHTGNANGTFAATIPIPVTLDLLQRGQERFNIFCSPCHSRLGDGNGEVAQRGFRLPQNLNSDRIRQVPPGYIFQVITNGYGGMPDHGDQIPVRDRWAIVAYIRALELSREAPLADVPADARAQLEVAK
jgi:mono/diheme cytochrome c family protein